MMAGGLDETRQRGLGVPDPGDAEERAGRRPQAMLDRAALPVAEQSGRAVAATGVGVEG